MFFEDKVNRHHQILWYSLIPHQINCNLFSQKTKNNNLNYWIRFLDSCVWYFSSFTRKAEAVLSTYSVQTYQKNKKTLFSSNISVAQVWDKKTDTQLHTEEEMNMAAMNILSQPWSPPASLCLYNFYNHNHYNISNYKLHSFSHPDNFSLPSSLSAPTKSNHTASRLSQMPTHLSKSGSLSYFSFNFWYFSFFFLISLYVFLHIRE